MRRISIVGNPGAGKTTFSRPFGQALGIKVVEMDRLFGHADKVKMTRLEREARLAEVLARPSYILDGGFSWTYPQRIAACDTLIWMELGMGRHFINVLRRSWETYGQREKSAPARTRLRERFPTLPFWIGFLREHGEGINHIRKIFGSPPGELRLIRLQSFDEAEAFLAGLPK